MTHPAFIRCTGCGKHHVYPGRMSDRHYVRTDVAGFSACGRERRTTPVTRDKDLVGCEACLKNMVKNHELQKNGGETRKYCDGETAA